MGVDARWYCETCQTLYAPKSLGGRSRWTYPMRNPSPKELRYIAAKLKELIWKDDFEEDLEGYYARFMELADWIEAHKGHDIQITNDGVYLDYLLWVNSIKESANVMVKYNADDDNYWFHMPNCPKAKDRKYKIVPLSKINREITRKGMHEILPHRDCCK